MSQGIMHGIPVPFIVCDVNSQPTYINQAMPDTWGRKGSPKDYLNFTAATFFTKMPAEKQS